MSGCSDDNEYVVSDAAAEEEILRPKLRRRYTEHDAAIKREKNLLVRRISRILKRHRAEEEQYPDTFSDAENALILDNPDIVYEIEKRALKRQTQEERKLEFEDSKDVLMRKCKQLCNAIAKAKNLVVYTGAGISTAANIPDYRGPNGVWTRLDKGEKISDCNIEMAQPTFTHMSLFALYKKGKLKHVVSQNCDGLHMRSGLPRYILSELHGNMFIEICKNCRPNRPLLRLFDVTERTSRNRHTTLRRCRVCGQSLYDTIVHFGERGSLKWPINWDGASKAAKQADVILCLGSSLKVLRYYPWLWCMDRPAKQRPKVYIVNLQWTPKDSVATLKLNGRCDVILRMVMDALGYTVPQYYPDNDPLLTYVTPLHPLEEHTTAKKPVLELKSPSSTIDNEDSESVISSTGSNLSSSSFSSSANSSKPETVLCSEKNGIKTFEPNLRRSSRNRRQTTLYSDQYEYITRRRVNRTVSALSVGQFVRGLPVEYKTCIWPRDTLYTPYMGFDFLDCNKNAYACDCCDPAFNRKRSGVQDAESSDQFDDSNSADESDSSSCFSQNPPKVEEKAIMMPNGDGDLKKEGEETGSTLVTKIERENTKLEIVNTVNLKPGWFGKGRRKKYKVH